MSFEDENDENRPDHGSQLAMPGLGPQIGSRYTRVQGGFLGTVVNIRPGKTTWVTLRYRDTQTDVSLQNLELYWRPFTQPTHPAKLKVAP